MGRDRHLPTKMSDQRVRSQAARNSHFVQLTGALGEFYCWLYYRCYRHSAKGDIAKHWANASLYTVMILFLNLVAVLIVLGSLFRTNFGIPRGLPHWVVGSAFGAIVLVHHFYLRRRERYKQIIQQFAKETPAQQRRGDLLFAWYVAMSFFALGVAAVAAFLIVANR